MILKFKQYYISVPNEIEQLIKSLDDEPNNGVFGLDKMKNVSGNNAVVMLENLFKVIDYNAGQTFSDNLLYQSCKDLLVQIYRVSHLHPQIFWEIDK